MKRVFIFPALLLTVLSSFLFVSCDNEDEPTPAVPNIVEFAQGDANFSLLVDDMDVTTLSNDAKFEIDLDQNPPMIMAGQNTANIVVTDVQTQNGVIHVIDTVILP